MGGNESKSKKQGRKGRQGSGSKRREADEAMVKKIEFGHVSSQTCRAIGRYGSNPGQLKFPQAILMDESTNHLIVSEWYKIEWRRWMRMAGTCGCLATAKEISPVNCIIHVE